MTKRKTLSVLLVLAILFSAMSFSAHAVGTSAEAAHLEDLATAYVENFVNTIYLYESPNLTAGTLKEHYAITENLTATQMPASMRTETVELCGTVKTAAELCESLSVAETYANYMKYIRSERNIVRENFNMVISVVDSYIDNNSACVHLYSYITFNYQNDPAPAKLSDNYWIYFKNVNGNWMIADVKAEEIENCGYDNILDTVDEMLESFNVEMADKTEAPMTATTGEMLQLAEEILPQAVPLDSDSFRAYDRQDAVAYAYTYTLAGYEGYDNPSYYLNNDLFYDFSAYGNCQNFVSQCLWAGFGGNNTVTAISSQEFPMHVSPYGWYYTTTSDRANWTSPLTFYNYLTGITSTSTKGMRTARYTIPAGSSFAGHATSTLLGSVLIVNSYDHAAIIIEATGTTYDKVKIAENSPMRCGITLEDQGYGNREMKLIVPQSMIVPQNCGTSSAHTYVDGYLGCTKCDHTKLRVNGNMILPINVGSTITISGSANATCYRMAMGITLPKEGNETPETIWLNVYSTSSISRSYTFSKVGLYTITISARDVTDADQLSSTDVHVFTIRVCG